LYFEKGKEYFGGRKTTVVGENPEGEVLNTRRWELKKKERGTGRELSNEKTGGDLTLTGNKPRKRCMWYRLGTKKD